MNVTLLGKQKGDGSSANVSELRGIFRMSDIAEQRAVACVVCGGITKKVYEHAEFSVLKCVSCTMAQVPGGGVR